MIFHMCYVYTVYTAVRCTVHSESIEHFNKSPAYWHCLSLHQYCFGCTNLSSIADRFVFLSLTWDLKWFCGRTSRSITTRNLCFMCVLTGDSSFKCISVVFLSLFKISFHSVYYYICDNPNNMEPYDVRVFL